MSDPSTLELCTVEVFTHQGSHYVFPDMDKTALRRVLTPGENRITVSIPSFAVCNASYAVLSLPFRIIKQILVDGEEWWVSPA